jgi:glyceraldehyde 3-phosphate dehydrogenase
MKLGINSMGRIGKLTVWHHLARRHFSGLVVNTGRPVGSSLVDLVDTLCKDSTYGHLNAYLHGSKGGLTIEGLNEATGDVIIDGMPIRFLREQRNPAAIPWQANDVRLVVDCTGVFLDPTVPADAPAGALRGHFTGGAEKIILSAPFKIRDKGTAMPADAITALMGINERAYNPAQHNVIAAASCTTTCLAFMIKPLIDQLGIERLLAASMVTIHAATGSQSVLDAVPAANAKDLRKSRSVFNNIILTTTGAAKALSLVIPEMRDVGFMAESVRIPTSTGSLVILTLTLQADSMESTLNRAMINSIFQEAAAGRYRDYLVYSEAQNVSSDIVGFPNASMILEAQETHTRTVFSRIKTVTTDGPQTLEIPITQAVLYGWYDNELGSYTNTLGKLTVHLADQMV